MCCQGNSYMFCERKWDKKKYTKNKTKRITWDIFALGTHWSGFPTLMAQISRIPEKKKPQECQCWCMLRIYLKLQLGAIKAGLQAKKCAATCTCHRLRWVLTRECKEGMETVHCLCSVLLHSHHTYRYCALICPHCSASWHVFSNTFHSFKFGSAGFVEFILHPPSVLRESFSFLFLHLYRLFHSSSITSPLNTLSHPLRPLPNR